MPAAILGAKILLIARLGIPTPYWDQWDAEAAGLYLPWLEGRLDAAHWLAFHNEHRLVLTRASALALLWLTGSWDPIVQMLFNASVHVAAIGLLIALLGRLLDLPRVPVLCGVRAAVLRRAVRLGQYARRIPAAVLLPDPAQRAEPAPRLRAGLERRAGCSERCSPCSAYFAMASGALILPAAIGLVALQIAVGRRSGTRELAGVLLHAALTLALLHDALSFAPHGTASIGAAIASFLVSASWPIAARAGLRS